MTMMLMRIQLVRSISIGLCVLQSWRKCQRNERVLVSCISSNKNVQRVVASHNNIVRFVRCSTSPFCEFLRLAWHFQHRNQDQRGLASLPFSPRGSKNERRFHPKQLKSMVTQRPTLPLRALKQPTNTHLHNLLFLLFQERAKDCIGMLLPLDDDRRETRKSSCRNVDQTRERFFHVKRCNLRASHSEKQT